MSYIFLIGRPCAGKDAVSSFIAEEYGYKVMTGSDIIRNHLLLSDSDKQAFYSGYIVNEGAFVDKLIEAVKALENEQIVFNGMPRTLRQLDLIFKHFLHSHKLVILMSVSDDDVFDRSYGRVVCCVCNKSQTYSGSLTCSWCLSEYALCKRVDDTSSVVRRRMDQYYEHTAPVVSRLLTPSDDSDESFKHKTTIRVVNCSNSLNNVLMDVERIVREYLSTI